MELQLLKAIRFAIGRPQPPSSSPRAWTSSPPKANCLPSSPSYPWMRRPRRLSSRCSSGTTRQAPITIQMAQILISNNKLCRELNLWLKQLTITIKITKSEKVQKTVNLYSASTRIITLAVPNLQPITITSPTSLPTKMASCSTQARVRSSKSCARQKCVATGRMATVSTEIR